jgi:hypothetical protein
MVEPGHVLPFPQAPDGIELRHLRAFVPGDARGFYGNLGLVILQVDNMPERPDDVLVVAATQARFLRSEAIAALQRAINAKDDPRNDVVLITCGLPDSHGYLCPMDSFLFNDLVQAVSGGVTITPPRHLQGVIVHDWSSGQLIEVWAREGSRLPWAKS